MIWQGPMAEAEGRHDGPSQGRDCPSRGGSLVRGSGIGRREVKVKFPLLD